MIWGLVGSITPLPTSSMLMKWSPMAPWSGPLTQPKLRAYPSLSASATSWKRSVESRTILISAIWLAFCSAVVSCCACAECEVTKQSQRKAKKSGWHDLGKTGADLETRALSYQFGDFTLDLARGCVLKGIQEIKLRPKVYEALRYLVEHPGRLVGKQELMQ